MEPTTTLTEEDIPELQGESDERLICRFYENEYPDVDDSVIVLVKNIADMGAYVSLIEYNNIEGMILLSELSRRRIRSINKLIRVGRMEICMVMRVDKEKGYIDLSRRRVAAEDVVKCEEKYSKAKAVHSIMRHVAQTVATDMTLEQLNKDIAWPLDRLRNADGDEKMSPPFTGTPQRPWRSAYEAFRVAISDPELVFNQPDVKCPEHIKNALLKVIKRKLTPQPIKIRADVKVTCFTEEGIEDIKDALRAGEAASQSKSEGKDEEPLISEDGEDLSGAVKIKLIAPPLYVMMSTALNKQKGLEKMNRAIEAVRKVLETKEGGRLEVTEPPRVTSMQDENALKSLLEKMELENQEVAADDENEE